MHMYTHMGNNDSSSGNNNNNNNNNTFRCACLSGRALEGVSAHWGS